VSSKDVARKFSPAANAIDDADMHLGEPEAGSPAASSSSARVSSPI
jgi:hypothetical protein